MDVAQKTWRTFQYFLDVWSFSASFCTIFDLCCKLCLPSAAFATHSSQQLVDVSLVWQELDCHAPASGYLFWGGTCMDMGHPWNFAMHTEVHRCRPGGHSCSPAAVGVHLSNHGSACRASNGRWHWGSSFWSTPCECGVANDFHHHVAGLGRHGRGSRHVFET